MELKQGYAVPAWAVDTGTFNRTSMELKRDVARVERGGRPRLAGLLVARGVEQQTFNRTSMELKLVFEAFVAADLIGFSFNRTSMELKLAERVGGGNTNKAFNRTSMELKLV